MSPRALVYPVVAVFALLVPAPGEALVMGALSVNGGAPVTAGAQAQAACTARADGTFIKDVPTTATFTSSDGAFDPVTVTFSGPDASSNYTATSIWTAPVVAGASSVTCTAFGSRYSTSNPTMYTGTLSVNVVVEAPPASSPVIGAVTGADGGAFAAETISLAVEATDPGGLPLTFAWTATGGSFTDSTAATTSWTAPALPGSFTFTVTVTNSAGMSDSTSFVVATVLAAFQGGLSATLRYPRRLAATSGGDLLAVDDLGDLHLLTKRGDSRGSIPRLEATAVTTGVLDGKEVAFVATRKRGILRVDPATGRQLGAIPWRASSTLSGLAFDGARKLLWASFAEARRAVAFTMDGAQAREIVQVEGRPLRALADVALDAATDTLWVAEKDGLTGHRVHAFGAADGSWQRSMVTAGSDLGEVVDTGGLALGMGRVYVSDSYGGTVQVMTSAGSPVGTIGAKGDVDGYLLHPRGLAFMANGDLAIANAWFNRIDRFGTGAALPTCVGDADCDGLPDDWELANGLDPNLASDALLDLDGDGLSNAEELALGTDPSKADTDGDGFGDREELLAGFDPLDGSDHRPTLVAGSSGKVPPGLVRLSATLTNANGCVASWKQLTGSKVSLRDAESFAPSFVARAAGPMQFEAVALCGTAMSAPATAQVEVENVAPMADAGRLIVTAPGRTVALTAGFSSDANGETLTYRWEQVFGPALAVTSRGALLNVRPAEPGYYAFELTATDKGAQQGSTVVGVVCVDDTLPTALVASPVLTAASGSSVTLDASASVPAAATFAWAQTAGPSVGAISAAAAPSVTLPSPGRYVFEVTASAGGVSSPPARVVVLAGEGGTLPVAAPSAPANGAVNTALTLDGAASTGSGALSHSWRQVAGPAAGVTGADGPVATVVPFAAGVYVFELTVADGSGAVSAPATVRIDVPPAGKALPVASASAPATAIVGELVVLNAKSSTGAARYRWTQLGGPWVAFDTTSATPVFTPAVAGAYTFELVVDDGTVRSAPATVTVQVQ